MNYTVLPKSNLTLWERFKQFMLNSFIISNCSNNTWTSRSIVVSCNYSNALLKLQLARIKKESEVEHLQEVANTRHEFQSWLKAIPFGAIAVRRPDLNRERFLKELDSEYPFRCDELACNVEPI